MFGLVFVTKLGVLIEEIVQILVIHASHRMSLKCLQMCSGLYFLSTFTCLLCFRFVNIL